MRRTLLATRAVLGGLLLAGSAAAAAAPPAWNIPTAVKKLDNGLTVVVSEDHTSPTFGISVVYGIGFRLEPQGRTGFAHLFEHMMFEGTPNAPKGVYDRVIQAGGGVNNGSTRPDYTNYIASAPVSALEPILWLEADRMKTLDFSPANLENQREVVKEEVRVNVKNRPYGLFFWTDLGALAFDKWSNSHDGYGSFDDLNAASLDDVIAFHKTFYAPNNAVVAIAGDVEPAAVFALVEKYFGAIPKQPVPAAPDFSEPLNTAERTLTQSDEFARVPGLAVGWKAPPPGSPDYAPAALLGDLLVGGEASRFYQRFVKEEQTLLQVQGGLAWPISNPLSNNGPTMLVVFGLYKPNASARSLVDAMGEEIAKVAAGEVSAEELDRTRTKMLSDFYSSLEPLISRANYLGLRQLFTGNAGSINDYPKQLAAVTVADLQRVASRYLTAANRSFIDRQPAAAPPAAPAAAGSEGSN